MGKATPENVEAAWQKLIGWVRLMEEEHGAALSAGLLRQFVPEQMPAIERFIELLAELRDDSLQGQGLADDPTYRAGAFLGFVVGLNAAEISEQDEFE
jgi:hypothetical protein